MNFLKYHLPFNTAARLLRQSFFVSIILLYSTVSLSQKKPIDHSVYDAWQSIGVKLWSADGKTAIYQVSPQEGDKLLYMKRSDSPLKHQLPRGENPVFTYDSKFAVALIKPFYKDIREAKIKKKKEEETPKDSLAIINTSSFSITKVALVKSFKVPEKGGSKLAYQLHKAVALKVVDSLKTDSLQKKKAVATEPAKKKDKQAEPLPLVLMDLVSGKQLVFENVVEYEFSKNGKKLVFATQEPTKKEVKKDEKDLSIAEESKKTTYGVYLIDTDTNVQTTLLEGNGEFNQFAFDELGNRVAFIGTLDEKKKEIKSYQLYSSFKAEQAQILASSQTLGMPDKWAVSEHRKPLFSRNGKKVFFGIAPVKIAKDTTLIVEDHAIVDVWHYKDDYLQTIQLKNLDKELKRSYLAVIQLDQPKTLVPLSDAQLQEVVLVDEGNADYVLGYSDIKGRLATQWTGFAPRDYYEINTSNGRSNLIVANLNGYAYSSPLGKYIVYFNREGGNWFSYHVGSKKQVALNKNLDVAFADEDFDMPDLPNAYGIAAWTDHDETVLIKDRYDIWEFSLNGSKAAHQITKGYGRTNKIRFDIEKLDTDVRSLSRKAPLLLGAFNEVSKDAGFFTTTVLAKKDPELLRMEAMFSNNAVVKAKHAQQYMYVKESFTQAPRIYTTTDFKSDELLQATNPQQANYNWGTASLIHWTTDTGKNATGILYKPEDFDEAKSYPMIVYFYEKLTDNLYRYEAPAPTPSRLNISYFVSNGYLVFTPDISYEKGYPGRSAEEYINSGVDFLKQNSWVDSKKIGIQGQSWGGYQVAHLITRTNRYAAAWSGAPVVNMTSAYGGIRWATGMNRQFQYEKTQSRIGANLWEAHELYIENSPLFFMDRVETPVVIMHNDNDGAVPWYQGIEMFTALRRLEKPVWMLNYNGDEHNLMQRQNRKDIQIREQQFFDHYLKGAPIPVWMDTGIPAVLKGKTWGFDLVK
ncbi:S9 family peptidase [Flavobacterium sp. HSC-61S13]|uniref:alpha/beta hydrolase family protein n=1 Tax=Flavobacterium sp. HSC-61S13 TaxID=2910963 RepID=UPI0020A2184B|nr:prolyl oligopeptidase family serine peptidase [Flavobacterium sp. HSC-61S13]MCP1996807.1 dipeptidyl aminopeptidase/acylaminoacyl peptidase [Flavobacterium sp. HSC-61S13]